jgi:ribosome-binding ATPase YchF (GTP1/OBG family)
LIRLGLIGKTNTGKTTFFNAATLQSAEVSTYPFTTKQPNYGIAYALSPCVDSEFGVKCNPKSAPCVEGWRYLPLELIDLPGLIKELGPERGWGTSSYRSRLSRTRCSTSSTPRRAWTRRGG